MPAAWGLFKKLRNAQQVVAAPARAPHDDVVLLPESFDDDSAANEVAADLADSGEQRTGAELWARARRRVQVYVATKRIFGDVQKIYGVDHTTVSQPEVDILREQALRRKCFWLPDSGFRQKWDVLLVALLAYIGTVTPFRESFDVQSEPWTPSYIFDIFVDMFFISDVFVRSTPLPTRIPPSLWASYCDSREFGAHAVLHNIVWVPTCALFRESSCAGRGADRLLALADR